MQHSSVFASGSGSHQEQAYDTVVDTFGLCSHADPVAVLQVTRSSAAAAHNAQCAIESLCSSIDFDAST